jgi:hypothetical protein
MPTVYMGTQRKSMAAKEIVSGMRPEKDLLAVTL